MKCSIPDCDDPVRARGWCSKHYQRWRKYGDPLFVKQVHVSNGLRQRYVCTECGGPHYALGLCQRCYRQQWNPERRAEYAREYKARRLGEERTCTKCGEWYTINRSTCWCDRCHDGMVKDIALRKWLKLAEYKLEFGCQKCGLKPDDPIKLEFHHRDPSTKSFDIAHGPARRSMVKIWEEVAKCDVLCYECHCEVDPHRRHLGPPAYGDTHDPYTTSWDELEERRHEGVQKRVPLPHH